MKQNKKYKYEHLMENIKRQQISNSVNFTKKIFWNIFLQKYSRSCGAFQRHTEFERRALFNTELIS